jgi:hypothetical protein
MKYDYELIPIGTPVPVSLQQYGTVIFNIDRHLHIRCMVTYPQTDTANAYLINDDFTRVVLGLYIHSACTFTFGFIVDDL